MNFFSNLFSNKSRKIETASEPQKPQYSVIDYCEQGQKSLDAEKYVEAMEFFQAAIEADSHFEKAYLLLATAYERQGKTDKAKATLYGLLAINPNHSEALERIDKMNGLMANQKRTASLTSSNINFSSAISINLKSYSGMTSQNTQSLQTQKYRVFEGKSDDAFDFFVILDDGNRIYFKISKDASDMVEIVPPLCNWSGFRKPKGALVIPSTIEFKGQGYVVKSIGKNAFYSCDEIQSVLIPNTIVRIENAAFMGCKLLSSVDLPLTLESIGESCFKGCAFDNIDIPESVCHIGKDAFQDCFNLTYFIFPSGVTTIESGVLNGCKILSEILIPFGIQEINNGAFGGNIIKPGSEEVNLIMESTIPPKIGASAFEESYFSKVHVVVTVPNGSLEAYETARYWQTFEIKESEMK